MSSPSGIGDLAGIFPAARRKVYFVLGVLTLGAGCFLIWPWLTQRLLATNFLPHLYCYLNNQSVVWTHVVADALIAISYLAISITLVILVQKTRNDIPLPWMLLTFGIFIALCGGTHVMEVVTVWRPVYVLSAVVKVVAAGASVATAVILPFTVPEVITLVRQAKMSDQVTERLRASEARKEALLREIHHRVKNNLAVICSLLYLQSTHTKDAQAVQVFREMERRVHSIALVHESLCDFENLTHIDFSQYARALVEDILSSREGVTAPVRMKMLLEPVLMTTDLAVSCGLILNELITNAFKHGFPAGTGGEIKLTVNIGANGACCVTVDDTGIGIPAEFEGIKRKSMGMRLMRSLTKQIGGSLEIVRQQPGTSARLQFTVTNNGN
jgi:two-component sensor histidine kinase